MRVPKSPRGAESHGRTDTVGQTQTEPRPTPPLVYGIQVHDPAYNIVYHGKSLFYKKLAALIQAGVGSLAAPAGGFSAQPEPFYAILATVGHFRQ